MAKFTKERNISYFFPRRNKRRYKLARLQVILNRFSAWKPLIHITFFLDSYRGKTVPSPKCIYERIDLSRNRLSPPKTGPLLPVSIETLNWRDCVRKICQRRDPRREISNVYDFSDSPVENTGEWKTRNSWEISSSRLNSRNISGEGNVSVFFFSLPIDLCRDLKKFRISTHVRNSVVLDRRIRGEKA